MNKPGIDHHIRFHRSWLIWLTIILFGGIYLAVVISNHFFFRTFCFDYGVYNNAFFDFAHFRVNSNPVFEPSLDRFCQVHMAFILNILSPLLYWTIGLITGTYTLLIFEVLIILTGGYFVFLLVKEKTGIFWFSLLALLHYFSLWGHFSALPADYIDTTIGASVVPIFLYYHVRRKFFVTSLLFLFILLTKENFPLWLIFISLTLILLDPKDKMVRKVNIIYIVIAIFYFITIFKFVIPAFEDSDRPYWGFAYSALGETPSDAFLNIFKHPLRTVKLLFINQTGNPIYNGIKAEFYFVFLISGGIVLFANPRYFLMFIPLIAQKMFNDHYLRWGINSFYSIEIVSILSIGVFITLSKLKNKKLIIIMAILVCISTLFVTINKLDHRKSLYYIPIKERFYDLRLYRSDFDVKKVNAALKMIPSEAKVAASERVVSHLAYRSHIYCFPYVRDANYIVLLLNTSTYPLTKEQFEEEKRRYLSDDNWMVIYNEYPLLILNKVGIPGH